MTCLHCGSTGIIVDVNEGRPIEFYCEHCDLGRHLSKQVCSNCGYWRGPKESTHRHGAPLCQCKRPMPGDAVLLTAPWSIAPAGSWGMIGGMCGTEPAFLHICFRANCFMDKYVTCSGGPATMALPAFLLNPSDGIKQQDFWKWKDTPRAGGGVWYSTEVTVWEWDGYGIIMRPDGLIIRLDN